MVFRTVHESGCVSLADILPEVNRYRKHAVTVLKTSSSHLFAGSDEGAFAWLTLNYLLGVLGEDGGDTMAAIDLGGGSVQEAFALTDAQAKVAPDPLYVTKLKGGGKEYSVYVHR